MLAISEDGRSTAAQAWHPNGQQLLINETVDHSDWETRMGVYDLETESVDWIANERGIAFVDGGERILTGDTTALYELDGSSHEIGIPGWTRFDPVAAANAITDHGFVVRRTSKTRPWEILYHDLHDETTTVLVESDFGAVDPADIVEPEEITHDLPNGRTAEGLLFDSGNRPSPAVVRIYGARSEPSGRFSPDTQLLTALGYTVVEPAFPGNPFTDEEHAAFANAGEWVKQLERIDDDRVAVFGHSHGGYNVYMQVVRYPEVWTAAIASSGMGDLLAADEQGIAPYIYWEMGDPAENTERWREQSPIEYVGETPVVPFLMIHGEEDFLSIEQPRQFVEALKSHGWTEDTDFEFVELEEYGHWSTASQDEVKKWENVIGFLERRV